jgi:hypothetical protein
MSKFWDWYDGLEATEPGFRFLLFIIMMLFCYLIIPAIIAFFCGRQYFEPCTWIGVAVMGVLAISKQFRWPK